MSIRIPHITFTRFIAALAVVIFHEGLLVYPFTIPLLTFFLQRGGLAVTYFFVLSGFILTVVYYPKKTKINLKDFYLARFARIYPVYFISLVVFIAFFIAFNLKGIQINNVLLSLFMLQSWITNSLQAINGPAWSLSVEFFFYLIFPFIVVFIAKLTRRNRLFFILISILITSLLYIIFNPYLSTVSNNLRFNPIFHLNSFFIGIVTGLYFLEIKKKDIKLKPFLLICIPIILFSLMILINTAFMNRLYIVLSASLFAIFILGLSLDSSKISKVFSSRLLIILGEISYGVYILQVPVKVWFYKLWAKLSFSSNLTLRFYLYLILLIIVSYLVYVCVEKSLRFKIRNYFK